MKHINKQHKIPILLGISAAVALAAIVAEFIKKDSVDFREETTVILSNEVQE
jgi:hypothetical protein